MRIRNMKIYLPFPGCYFSPIVYPQECAAVYSISPFNSEQKSISLSPSIWLWFSATNALFFISFWKWLLIVQQKRNKNDVKTSCSGGFCFVSIDWFSISVSNCEFLCFVLASLLFYSIWLPWTVHQLSTLEFYWFYTVLIANCDRRTSSIFASVFLLYIYWCNLLNVVFFLFFFLFFTISSRFFTFLVLGFWFSLFRRHKINTHTIDIPLD